MLELILPVAPSVNTYYRKFNNRMIISEKGRDYQKQVQEIVRKEKPKSFQADDRLRLEVDFYPPDKRRRDLDNFCGKALQDSLQYSGIYYDDEQIDSVEYTRCEIDRKNPRMEVRLEKIQEFDLVEVEDDDEDFVKGEFTFQDLLLLCEIIGRHILEITPEDLDYWEALEEQYDESFPYEKTDLFIRLIYLLGEEVFNKQLNPEGLAIEEITEFNKRLGSKVNLN